VIHLRTAAYLAEAMAGAGLEEDARQLGALHDGMIDSFARFYREQCAGEPRPEPTLAIVTLPSRHRGSRVLWRRSFARRGWRCVEGTPDDVRAANGELLVRGRAVDVLWGDFLFYQGYQFARYSETRYASRFGDFRAAPVETARLLGDAALLELLAERRVVNISPPRAYLALSKHLLSWIHRSDRPVAEELRPWLAAHVARTYAAADRLDGVLSLDEATRRREELVLKPCQYGGAHGVVAGSEMAPSEWAARLATIWTDADWVLQELHSPAKTVAGEYVSLGLYNYGGVLGGVTIRTAPSLVVSARKSAFIPVVCDGA
jgi:hypothetical protein